MRLQRMSMFGLLLICAVVRAWTQTSNPFEKDTNAVDVGRGLFRVYCRACHGVRAQGETGRAPDLTRQTFHVGDRDADLFRAISAGIDGTEMPGWKDRLSVDNIWRIVAFIRSSVQGESLPSGDLKRGEELFWGNGACASCHAVGNRGNRVGPDLTRIGRQRSVGYLRTSLLKPNDDIAPNYETVTVITRDGRKITGIEKGFDDFSEQLMQLNGRFYSFDISELKSVDRHARSLMPEYGTVFTESQINDLLAYLISLGEQGVPR